MWRGCGKTHRFAKIVSSAATSFTGVAAYTRLEGYSIADSKVLDVFPASFNDTCRLVTEHDWVVHDIVANATVLPVVDLYR
jgi:hypothetical protein